MKRPLKQGSKVYCNCYVGNRQDDRSFLCRGVVAEAINDKLMKVLITGVNTFSIGEPVSNRILKSLLGKTVPRNMGQISTSLSVIAMKLYEGGKWLCWEDDKVKRILKQQREKKKEEKKDGNTRQSTTRNDNARSPRGDKQKDRKDRGETGKA